MFVRGYVNISTNICLKLLGKQSQHSHEVNTGISLRKISIVLQISRVSVNKANSVSEYHEIICLTGSPDLPDVPSSPGMP